MTDKKIVFSKDVNDEVIIEKTGTEVFYKDENNQIKSLIIVNNDNKKVLKKEASEFLKENETCVSTALTTINLDLTIKDFKALLNQ